MIIDFTEKCNEMRSSGARQEAQMEIELWERLVVKDSRQAKRGQGRPRKTRKQ